MSNTHAPRRRKAVRNGDHGTLEYEVGYGKPPKQARFKPGQSGNPRGRPKQRRHLRTLIEEALNETVTIREGDRKRTLPKREALVRTLVNGALMKDVKALQALLTVMRATGLISEEPEAAPPQELSPEDQALIADFLRRAGQG